MLLGADIEMMCIDGLGNPMPVCSLLGGTKEDPIPVQSGAYQEDNVNAEFNITPTENEQEWVDNMLSVMQQVEDRLKPHKLTLAAIPSFHYTIPTLEAAGKEAVSMGCSSDMNVWTGERNPKPNPFQTLRTAGGHIHFDCSAKEVEEVVKLFDVYLGVPSVLLDVDIERRNMYGQAGAYREKPYGGEYRTLSNFWLRSPVLIQWVFRQAQKAKENLHQLDNILSMFPADVIQNCINNGDIKTAKEIVSAFDLEVVADECY